MSKTYVVQCPHPGGERLPKNLKPGGQLPWNNGNHGRKFLLSDGTYFDGSAWHSGLVIFWGEWEPQSTVEEILPVGPGLPKSLQRPHFRTAADLADRQNTDPLVFGGHFVYSNCRQATNSRLKALTPGSVILFGSKVNHRFVLDTVLVISSRTPYRPIDGIEGPDYLEPLVTGPLAANEKWRTYDFVCYRGAAPDAPVDGMYSFTPCQTYRPGERGFARPTLHLDDLLNHNLAMAARTTALPGADARAVWQRVVDQVLDAGLFLGASFPLPRNL